MRTGRRNQIIFIIAIIAAIVTSIMLHSAYVVNTPIAHWKFDGDLFDSGKYHYQAVGEAEYIEGKRGLALKLNGENTIMIKDNPTTRLQGPFTLSLWAKNDELSVFAGLLGRSYGQIDTGGFHIYNNNGDLRFKRDSQNMPIAMSTDLEEYHHIVITYDGEKVTAYFDGIARNSDSIEFGTPINNSDLLIGKPLGTGGFKGNIDDMRFYDKTLSPLDVLVMHVL